MVVCALLVPSQDESKESFELVQEVFKCLIGLVDVGAVFYALNYGKTGSNEHNPAKLAACVLGCISPKACRLGWDPELALLLLLLAHQRLQQRVPVGVHSDRSTGQRRSGRARLRNRSSMSTFLCDSPSS